MMRLWICTALCLVASVAQGDWRARIEQGTAQHIGTVVELRHDFHANPELGNRELTRT